MTQEALKLALEALIWIEPCDRTKAQQKAITAIKEALAQTQEPWCMKMNDCKTKCEDCPDEPPHRTWVGLTDEEAREIQTNMVYGNHSFIKVIQAIEAKLKEKNT